MEHVFVSFAAAAVVVQVLETFSARHVSSSQRDIRLCFELQFS